ncbi:MAG: SDR family oxidoreductase [Patescibacteria group bacterium]|nr:SDR family oxidoreductase [Patescibacteria group bacterium]
MKIKNKIVVITGGSQGLGKSLASQFAKQACRVIISSEDKKELKKTAKELSVDSFLADVTVYDNLSNLGKYVLEKYGTIDIWVNNAGIQIAPNLVEEVDIKKLHHLFEMNFFGYFYGCQIALRQIKKQGSGLIININSTAGLEGKPKLSAYSSSKFAIKGLTESIRKEIANPEIKIYSVYPGGIQTDIYKEKYPDDIKEYMQVDDVAEKVIKNLMADKPEQDLIIRRPIVQKYRF